MTKESSTPDDIDEYVQTNAKINFRPFPAQSPWAAKPAPGDKNDITGAFTVYESGSDYYERQVPDKFSNDSDDLLMRSAISTYAVEGKGDNGGPNGKFFITRAGMNGLADEVLSNNLGFTDSQKKEAYANEHLQKIWDHFDMFGKGYIPVEEVPQFCRMLIGEVEVQNSLQVQLADSINLSETTLEKPIDQVVLQYRPTVYQAPWSAKAADTKDHSPIYKAFPIEMDGSQGYERKVPDRWDSTSADDLLVRSVISTYALEGRNEDGNPTGKFYLTQKELYNVGKEVVNTHLGFSGSKLSDYLDQHVPAIYAHFDNTNKGYILAEEAPAALRLLLAEVEIQNGLQV